MFSCCFFSFSIFSDQWSLEIENENNTKSLIYRTRFPEVQVFLETNPGWLELPLIQTNFHGPKPV